MPEDICPKCNNVQSSLMDRTYLQQNGQCWSCDKKEWEEGKLTTEELERRERQANQAEEG